MTKAELHKLVDELPETSVEVAGKLLRRAVDDPEMARLFAAPKDDEPYTDEQRAEDKAALEAIDRGEGIEWSEAKQRLKAAG
jgi:hypothetical protein